MNAAAKEATLNPSAAMRYIPHTDMKRPIKLFTLVARKMKFPLFS